MTEAAKPQWHQGTKKTTIEFFKKKLAEDDGWAVKGLLRVYRNQTSDEQASETTKHHNSIGFTGLDAEFLTSLAKHWERHKFLSPKQMQILHKRLPKYAGQLYKELVPE